MDEKRRSISSVSTGQHTDFLQLMILAQSENRITSEGLVDNLITLFFGGFDTTSITLSYALYLLWRHPEARQQVVNEARTVLTQSEASYDQANQLKYTAAVVKEAMRLFPPAPVTARYTITPLELDGVTIPAGALIYIPIWLIHRTTLNWKDPLDFRPERFLTQQVESAVTSDDETIVPYSWIPFSGGQRNCVGQRFAMLEAPLLLARVVSAMNFDFPDDYDPQPISTGPVQKPGNPMIVTARVRDDGQ